MEYFEAEGGAVAQLSWQTSSVARQIIPAGPLQLPARANAVNPNNGDVNVPQDVTLEWTAGEKVVQHQIYFGDDEEAVTNATPADTAVYLGQQAADVTTYALSGLEWNTTYYWRVDEVNATDPESPWKSNIWSFTTADFIIVDDFESYTNDVGNRVFQTWIDGLGYTEPAPGVPGNGTGAIVGHDIWNQDSPHYEGEIVETANPRSGAQAMPLYFSNVATPYYSEAERTWATTQDWTVNDVNDLSLWLRGNPVGSMETGPGSFVMSASGADIWGTADEFRFLHKPLNGNGSIIARVDSILETNGWAKAGVMIRESLLAGSKHATVAVTPQQGVSFQRRTFTNADSEQHNQTPIEAPHWVKLTRTGNTFKAEHSTDGVTWTSVGADPAASSLDITMINNVYVGLCVTSHNAAAVTVAEFSGVETSGGVSGQWQDEEVGVDHPNNDRADVYVAVEDSAGHVAAVPYFDGSNVTDWAQWKIPLSEFTDAGVNLAAVRKMYLGVGDRDNPIPDGEGVVFFDDIHVVRPEPVDPNG
jgi:hypothetical protein